MTAPPSEPPRSVLVLGAYGLVGAGIVRHLVAQGCRVIGLGRQAATAKRVLPNLDWIIRDLATLQRSAQWRPLLAGIDLVVNCAGALQEGPGDDLAALHQGAIAALAEACAASGCGLVQISAVGATPDATTAFLRTKALGDQAIREAGVAYWIFRPGLVLAPEAYGGSALLRLLAAVPLVQPLACRDARIQTVALGDLAEAVLAAVQGEIPDGSDCDLVEEQSHSLGEVIAAQRRWLGFATARRAVLLPAWCLSIVARCADLLGRLGWRSPLRSTAIAVLSAGVVGDPAGWRRLGRRPLSGLSETLAALPARAEDRLAARMALLMAPLLATLFLFWFLSGLVGLLRIETAAQVLETAGWSRGPAQASVAVWSLVDLLIAGALLFRRSAAAACWAMVGVSLVYLLAATLFVPALWLDPLGPLVKVLPGLLLALVALVLLERR
ncbi:MAG: SDR family oxidoreductase [Rhodospirillales bacterium]